MRPCSLSALALWIRGGADYSILETLPFVERRVALPPDYDWAALAVLVAGIWSLTMIHRTPAGRTPGPARTAPVIALVLVPAVVVVLATLTERVTLAVRFADVVGQPRDPLKHRCLATLALGVIALLLATRWWRAR